ATPTAAAITTAAPAAAAPAAVAASASTATAPATTAATAKPAPTIFLGTRFVDGQRAAVVLLPIQGGDRGRRFLVRGHLDKAEALAPAGVAIVDNLGAGHLTVLPKQLFEIRAGHVVAQIPHVKLLTHLESPVNG